MPDKKTRNPNGRSSIYLGADEYWHGRVTVGVTDNGKPDRRHTMSKNKQKVVKKVQEWEKARDTKSVLKAGESWTVDGWLMHWIDNVVAPPVITENAWIAYDVAVRVHLIPGLGAHKLDKLEPEHIEKLYRKMTKSGAKPGRVHQVHRTLRAALNEAVRREKLTKNPVLLARSPKLEEDEVEPYSVVEVKRLLLTARQKRNSARWAIALALGLRQGEALGLQWSDVSWDEWDAACAAHQEAFCLDCVGKYSPGIIIRRSRLRPKWQHGCGAPCGRKFGGHCPNRVPLRAETAGTKSRAGKRGIGLPNELALMLHQHQTEQDTERTTAGQMWRETGYVFTTPTGEPLNPRTDYTEWKRLLVRADVPERRLHDARHTAATVLLLLQIPDRTVMGVMGWSNTAMAARYQHVIAAIRRDVATSVGGLLWQPSGQEDRRQPNDDGGGAETPSPAA
jgi:integrase